MMDETVVKLGDKRYASAGADLADIYLLNGWSWDVATDYQSLSAAAEYETIHFVTPATGTVLYAPLKLDKTGNELVVSLVEGGTFVPGTAATITPRRENRKRGDANSPWGTILLGNSTGTGTTITGGVQLIPSLVPGTAQGNSKPPATSSAAGVKILENGTGYTVKILAKGAATMAALLSIVHIPEGE